MTEVALTAYIIEIAAQGLKIRDIASLLHVHPLIVVRILAKDGVVDAFASRALIALETIRCGAGRRMRTQSDSYISIQLSATRNDAK